MRFLLACIVFIILTACNELVDGYTDKVSYAPDDSLRIFLNYTQKENTYISLFSIDRQLIQRVSLRTQPQEIKNPEPWKNGFGYTPSLSLSIDRLEIPESGIYFWEHKVPFVVRGKSTEKITVVYPFNTINAYNRAGGKSMYYPKGNTARVASFLRPHEPQKYTEEFFEWLPKQGFGEINYIADSDLDNYESFQNSDLIIIPGHNEYWTRKARENFDRFIDSGKNAIILSGNTMWWQVRYSEDGSQLICHRYDSLETIADTLLFTKNWTNEELKYPVFTSIGADFLYGGYGMNEDKGWDGFKVITPESPLFEGVEVKKNQVLSILSAEYDGVPFTHLSRSGVEVDTTLFKPYKFELLGFDICHRIDDKLGAFYVYQRSPHSGIIINAATTDWCSANGMGGKDGDKLKKITKNMIIKLLNKERVFSH